MQPLMLKLHWFDQWRSYRPQFPPTRGALQAKGGPKSGKIIVGLVIFDEAIVQSVSVLLAKW